jgi:hypothetical protein
MPRRQPKSAVRRERGFALLITITLLAFLVLLLVSLASLTRVETQVASNNQQLAQARQNALMALNIAIGQLQKYAGPDQRTTARADLENGPVVPNARWTGVYGSAVPADYSQIPSVIAAGLTNTANITPATGSPARLLTWLVSGNENGVFDPSTHVGSSGEITATASLLAAGLDYKPTATDTGLSDSASTSSTLKITKSDGTQSDAALLVGPGSVRTAVSGAQALDYVAAPLVKIQVPEKSLPGFSTSNTGTATVGQYAWWVGDEGAKARVNLPLPSASADKPAAFANSPRAAVELMAGSSLEEPPAPLNATRISTDYDPSGQVERVLTGNQISLLGTPSSFKSYRYHDLTTQSYSVLSDTYAGGLKRDLSALLATGYTAPATDATTDSKTLYTSEDGTTYGMPTWRHLRSFAQTTVPSSGTDANVLTPRLPRFSRTDGKADDVGVSPVLTYSAIGFRYAAAAPPADSVAINFNIYPLVVLWNPYTSKLKGHIYEVGMGHSGWATRVQLQMEDPSLVDPANSEAAWVVKETRDLRYGGMLITSNYGTDKAVQYFRFRVNCPDLEAGESVVFTLPSSTNYTAGVTTLEPGLNQTTCASTSGSSFATGEASRRWRFVTSSAMMKPVPGTGTSAGSGINFSNGGGAETYAYLGDVRTTAPSTTSSTEWWTPSMNNWYQALQRVGYDTSTVVNPLQGPGPLDQAAVYDEPALKWFIATVFSSTGSNKTMNKGTVAWIRWLAQSNIRAPHSFRTRRDPNYSTSYIAQVGTDAAMWPTWFSTDAPGNRASAGLTHDWDSTTNKPVSATLFEFRRDDQPLLSIGQLQQANLSLVGDYPAYAVGNGIADFRLPNFSSVVETTGVSGITAAASLQKAYYDASFLLNRTLWDAYFFSSVPDTGTATTPANPRHIVHDSAKNLKSPDEAAAGLMIAGGFNINSTSEQAWRAVLGGIKQLAYDPVSGTGGPALSASFPRFSRPTAGTTLVTASDPTTGANLADLWQGYRSLSDDQVAQLARNIVAEIRSRGPFISLGDFINRRLADNNSTTDEDKRLKGTLQAAIDATPLTTGSAYAPNDSANGSYWSVGYRTSSLPFGDGSLYSLEAARGDHLNTTAAAYQRRAAFAPKFITQADILSAIGAGLSARSDTFTVRTYGESLNPVTGASTGRAWCEAVVQREPEYVDPSGNAPEAAVATLTTSNRRFGRQFKIISFRWLSPSDI